MYIFYLFESYFIALNCSDYKLADISPNILGDTILPFSALFIYQYSWNHYLSLLQDKPFAPADYPYFSCQTHKSKQKKG